MNQSVSIEKKRQLEQIVSGIFQASIRLNRIGEELLTKSDYKISSTGLGVLVTIHREDGELTVPQIAERFIMSRQAVQRQIQTLLDDGIVQKCENPNHKRSHCYSLTQLGHKTYQAVMEDVFDPWLDELVTQYDDLDLGATLAVLQKITNM